MSNRPGSPWGEECCDISVEDAATILRWMLVGALLILSADYLVRFFS